MNVKQRIRLAMCERREQVKRDNFSSPSLFLPRAAILFITMPILLKSDPPPGRNHLNT